MPLEWRRHRERGGDFYLATRGEFFMATYRFESRRQVNLRLTLLGGPLNQSMCGWES
jgi:hypothetical protein